MSYKATVDFFKLHDTNEKDKSPKSEALENIMRGVLMEKKENIKKLTTELERIKIQYADAYMDFEKAKENYKQAFGKEFS